jgi:hypothetical protein
MLNELYSPFSTRRRYKVWFLRSGLADEAGAPPSRKFRTPPCYTLKSPAFFRGNPEGNSVNSSTGVAFTVRIGIIKISTI